MHIVSQHRCHGGTVLYVEHASRTNQCNMRFSIFLPPQANQARCATLFYLSGLTCTEDNFTVKANAYADAARLGLIIVAPDTSPRGEDVPDEESYDFGKGAGFYVDATQAPWRSHYHMASYITHELRELVIAEFPVDAARVGIFGHSMGGHGALTLYLKHPEIYRSVSAFAPICASMQCGWGVRAMEKYLGNYPEIWRTYDASALMEDSVATWGDAPRAPILIDQGLADNFLKENLLPHVFEVACEKAGHPLTLRRHEGYDHGYFFIQTFIRDHLEHHAAQLGTQA